MSTSGPNGYAGLWPALDRALTQGKLANSVLQERDDARLKGEGQDMAARILMGSGTTPAATPNFQAIPNFADGAPDLMGIKAPTRPAPAAPLMSDTTANSLMNTAIGPKDRLDAFLASQAAAAKPYDLVKGAKRFVGGREIASNPDTPEGFKVGATREVRIGDQTHTQEFQGNGTWKDIGVGAAFAPQQPKAPDVQEFFDEATGRPYKGVLQPDGSIKRLGGISTPAKTFNNDQNKAAGFAASMVNAENEISGIKDGAGSQYKPSVILQGIEGIPGWAGGGAGTANSIAGVTSPEYQKYRQAANDWTLALLRHESGANVPDSEAEKYWKTYFPQPGDGTEVVAQKAKARAMKQQGVIAASGGAFEANKPPAAAPGTTAPGAPQEGQTATNKATGAKIVFKGGKWQPAQ